MTSRPSQTPITGLRIVGGNITGALVLFGVVATFTVPVTWPHDVLFAVTTGLSVLSAVAAPLVGRLRPLPPGTSGPQARKQGVAAFQRAFFLQFAIIEAPALFALVVSFIVQTVVPYYVSAVIAVLLWLLIAYPTDKRVARAERRLDSAGGTSDLAAALSA
ncbi:hypothetical protein [Hamadaea tsunoensis]|uniref:hypothetical protein n=1 Tax=Hamadaea tsunoensis TaxID=53368 RepID=UPI0012FCC33F|nr:hypothetical protein [Hamadaea tsunoensis]